MKLNAFIIIAAIAAASCSSSDGPSDPEPVGRPQRAYIEQLIPRFDSLARQRIESIAVADALEVRLTDEAKRPWAARIEGGLKYADLLLEVYRSVDWTLSFAQPNGSTPRASGIVARLEQAPRDALENAHYHLAEISELRGELSAHALPPARSFALDAQEAERAIEWLESDGGDLADPATLRRLVDAVLGLHGPPLAPRLYDVGQRHRADAAASHAAIIELELRTADAALRFARDMRHFNYKRLSWSELAERGGGKQVVYTRLEKTLRQLFDTADPAAADEILTELRPGLVQYDRLLEALARYRAMPDWAVVSPLADEADPEALRQRLAAEGFDSASLDEAIASYQTAHQFDVEAPNVAFWRSLNVTRDRRIAQIELTLQRYRETFFRDEEDFVFVNIPDFHAEVFRHGERRMRFRVVVGNTERVCDPQTQQWRYPNATPVQWAPLEHMMLNPWWNVPNRLFTEEIEPRAHDQAWLEQKGFELYEERGVMHARQRPGANNALGLVKFIFPNEHDTYMHDTPSKQYFARTVRTFSHGCVRVEDPLALAEYFMTEYELGTRERLDRIMELGSTIRIDIPGTIPVFFEYYTVRVNDGGDVEFLADPYRLDEQRLWGEPDTLSCAPRETDADETQTALTAQPANPDDQGP